MPDLVERSTPSPGVLLLTLARKPVNALNDALFNAIQAAFERADQDNDVRVVVLASAMEKTWTAGLDLTENNLTSIEGEDPARMALSFKRHIHDLQASLASISSCSKPVIAALHGLVIGGGIDIASHCDVRLSASNARFTVKEIDVALAADLGTLQLLPRQVGNDSRAREWALTGRWFDAAEAAEVGWVRKVEGGRKEVLDEALKLAVTIAEKSPVAVVGTKHLLNYSREHTLREGLEYTAIWNMSMLQTGDLGKAMEAFVKKKPAKFAKL